MRIPHPAHMALIFGRNASSDLQRLALWLLILIGLMLAPRLAGAEEPEWCEDGYLCIEDDTARQVRQKARGFEVICSQASPPEALPPALAELCEEPSGASRIWVRAERYRKAEQRADEMQREANVAKGKRAEAVRETKALRQQVEALSEDKGRALEARKQWRAFGLGAAGVAVVTGGILLGDVANWWDVP